MRTVIKSNDFTSWWTEGVEITQEGASEIRHTATGATGALPAAQASTQRPPAWLLSRGVQWYSQRRQEGPNQLQAIWDNTAFPYWSPTLLLHHLSAAGRLKHQWILFVLRQYLCPLLQQTRILYTSAMPSSFILSVKQMDLSISPLLYASCLTPLSSHACPFPSSDTAVRWILLHSSGPFKFCIPEAAYCIP